MIGNNKGQPIAVIDAHGVVLPFTTNGVDAIHLLRMGVTYIYTEEQLKTILANNESLIDEHQFDSPNMYNQADKTLRLPKPRAELNRNESRVVYIDPMNVAAGTTQDAVDGIPSNIEFHEYA